MITYNKQLLEEHLKKAAEIHYKKGDVISELFEEDKRHFSPMPAKRFNVCRYHDFKCNGYDGSELLFQSDSYESKSMILTTNLEFSKWGSIFTDEQMAAAMIARLVHHGLLLMFSGKSYRMEHALMRQTAPQTEKIYPADFREFPISIIRKNIFRF